MYVTISVSMHSKIALSLESAVHKMRNEFELSMDSQRLCSTGIFVPSVAFPVRSRLAFKANDSSYVFKILIGKVVAKRPELWEQTSARERRPGTRLGFHVPALKAAKSEANKSEHS